MTLCPRSSVAAPQVLVEMSPSGWGIDYTFECIGSVEVRGAPAC